MPDLVLHCVNFVCQKMKPVKEAVVDLGELRSRIVKRIGIERAKRYFYYLKRFLSQKSSKSEFDKLCYRVLGKENIQLHNHLIWSILKNACHAKIPQPMCKASFTKSVIVDGKVSSPMEVPASQCSKDQIALAVVEDGDELEQAAYLNISRIPLIAPLGIPFCSGKIQGLGSNFVSCLDSSKLSNTEMLKKRMEQIAVSQGLGGVSIECANTMNNMLDVHLKRMIKSSVDLVKSKSMLINGSQTARCHQSCGKFVKAVQTVSLVDFRAVMELNPQQLGEDWPFILEKICMCRFER